MLVKMFNSILEELDSSYNIKVIGFVVDFFTEHFRSNFDGKILDSLPLVVSRDLCIVAAAKIRQIFPLIKHNKDLANTKFCQALELIFACSLDPLEIYNYTRDFLLHFYESIGNE